MEIGFVFINLVSVFVTFTFVCIGRNTMTPYILIPCLIMILFS